MTNRQRIEVRIARDKYRKRMRKESLNIFADDFSKVITAQHFVDALKKCHRGVNWKGSVQKYTQRFVTKIDDTITSLENNILPKLISTEKVLIYERGKIRVIVPIKIEDRMTQRVLCDYSISPVIVRTLIYDNGASLPGKGVEFTRRRIELHLKEAIREYGNNFYALVFDFKSFFDSIPHKTCLKVLKKHFKDKRIIGLIMAIIRSYQEPDILAINDEEERKRRLAELYNYDSRGICLGSQISQLMALCVPGKLDHTIKDVFRVRHYIRYMDDGIILSKDKEFLHELFNVMIEINNELGLKFNIKKTRIVPMSKGFTFLKVKYHITNDGKLIKTLTRKGIVRMRRKLKKFYSLVNNGKMTLDDVYNSMQSWLAHAKVAKSYRTVKSMLRLYDKLFGGYKITKKYFKRQGGKNGEVLQVDKWKELRWDSDNI